MPVHVRRACCFAAFAFAVGTTTLLAAEDRPAEPLCAYRVDDFNRARARALAESMPSELSDLRSRLTVAKARIERIFAATPSVTAAERVAKRLEIAERLGAFIGRNLDRGDVASVLFAEQGISALRRLGTCLRHEVSFWATNPANPSVRPVVFRGVDFGLVGDGKTDESAALIRAETALRELRGRPAVLELAAGTHRFRETRTNVWQRTHVHLEGLTNVWVRGTSPDETRLVFTDNEAFGIVLYKCANVMLSDVEIFWEDALHAEGKIVSVDRKDGAYVVQHVEGTMLPDDRRFRALGQQAMACFTPDGHLSRKAHTILTDKKRKVENLGQGRYRIPVDRTLMKACFLNSREGDYLEIPCRNRKKAALAFDGELNTFENVRVLNSPAGAFGGNGYTTLSRCTVRPKRGLRISTNADGFICSSGSCVMHCEFSGMLDDGHNPCGYGGYLASQEGNTLVYKSRRTYLRPGVGEMLVAMRTGTGQYLANLIAASETEWTQWKSEREFSRTAFENIPPDLMTYETLGSLSVSADDQADVVYGRSSIAAFADQVYQPGKDGVGGVVSDCRIFDMRGKAFSLQSANMLVEDLRVENMLTGLGICSLADWMEGPAPYNVTVRRCSFRDVEVPIRIEHRLTDRKEAFVSSLRGLRVSDVMIDHARMGLSVANVGDSVFENICMNRCASAGELKMCEDVEFRNGSCNDSPLDVGMFNAKGLRGVVFGTDPVEVKIDPSVPVGRIKPLHGVGQPPVLGLTDYSMFRFLKEAGIPFSRLHDVGGAFGGNVFVDIPNVFRDFTADETDETNYDFAFTDKLVGALVDAGVEPFFRLGVTIENDCAVKAYRIHPPADFQKWARICEHVIRHYTEGWANGHCWNIRYWEIWNEPDGDPDPMKCQCWRGTFDQYLDLYETVSKHLKRQFPHLRFGGYGSCGFYAATGSAFVPAANSSPNTRHFLNCFREFLCRVQERKCPLDFFTFHSYSGPERLVRQIEAAMYSLHEFGLDEVEGILDEWLPSPISLKRSGSAGQAADVALTLIGAQRTRLAAAMLYDARCKVSSYAPLFDATTRGPTKTFHALKYFDRLFRLGDEIGSVSTMAWPNFGVLSAIGGNRIAVLIANGWYSQRRIVLNVPGFDICSVRLTADGIVDRESDTIPEVIPENAVVLVELKARERRFGNL